MEEEFKDKPIIHLLDSLLMCWDEESPFKIQTLFSEEGSIIDSDGTIITGNKNIFHYLKNLFQNKKPPHIVYNIREIKIINNDLTILIAEIGMYRKDYVEIDSALNSILCMTAIQTNQTWKIEHLQFTSASYPNNPDTKKIMTDELNKKLKRKLLEKTQEST
jgi:uncharacterized protein (TIGR02246 family)